MSIERLSAIVRADFLIRFRRLSTAVVFLLLSFSVYLWIPDPSTGRALIVIDGKRAIYNSGAIGMGTASLGAMFIGLIGFYVISNALQRDVRNRCGFVIASTPASNLEYLLGKYLGNVVFLSTFMAGYMIASMAMLLIRAEAPLEPLVFMKQYLYLTPGAITMVSMIAVVFECVPFLRSRFGDFAYFFLWMMGMSIVAISIEGGGPPAILRFFDFSGLGFMVDQMSVQLNTTSVSIGASGFGNMNETILFRGLELSPVWILPKVLGVFLPLALLPIGVFFFHRFDPAKVKRSHLKKKTGWLSNLHLLLKPVTRLLAILAGRASDGKTSLFNAARQDAVITLSLLPVAVIALVVFAFLSIVSPVEALRTGALPILFALLSILIADISTREQSSGVTGIVFAAPHIKERFVAWKLLTTMIVAALFTGIAFVRLVMTDPFTGLAFLGGTFFVCAAATGLGITSNNPKTFIVLFLMFWYIVVNDAGNSPVLDFAGLYGTITPGISLTYIGMGIAFLALGSVVNRARLRQQGF